jgi:hypothetical protein
VGGVATPTIRFLHLLAESEAPYYNAWSLINRAPISIPSLRLINKLDLSFILSLCGASLVLLLAHEMCAYGSVSFLCMTLTACMAYLLFRVRWGVRDPTPSESAFGKRTPRTT